MVCPPPLLTISLAALLLAPSATAGTKGFADKQLGGRKDPLLGLAVSIGPNLGGYAVPTAKSLLDPCGEYLFDAGAGRMAVPTPRVTFPTDANGANQFIAIAFPFPIAGKKALKTIMKNSVQLAPTSYLTTNVTVTNELGQHVRGIPVIAGRRVDGTPVQNDPWFPQWLDTLGQNRLLAKNVFVYVADQGDGLLSTASAFGPAPGNADVSTISELRVRLTKVAGISMHGAWVVKRGDLAGAPVEPGALVLQQIAPTRPVVPPAVSAQGHQLVKRTTDFLLTFNEPVVPLSVGVEKKWIKGLGGTFQKNLGVTLHPCDGSPLFPNVVLEWVPDQGPPKSLGFDAFAVNPNNRAHLRLKVLDKPKGKGDLTVRVLPISQNVNAHPFATVASSITSAYDVPFDDTITNALTFRIE